MARAEKAYKRPLSKSADYTCDELRAVMESFGYELKTSAGSSRKFIHRQSGATLMMHEPHPRSILKMYQVRDVIAFLKQENHL